MRSFAGAADNNPRAGLHVCVALTICLAVNLNLTVLINSPPRKAMSGFGAWFFAAPLLSEVSCPVKSWGLGLTLSSVSRFKVLRNSGALRSFLRSSLLRQAILTDVLGRHCLRTNRSLPSGAPCSGILWNLRFPQMRTSSRVD